MGNNNSGPRPGERSLHDFMANQNFRNNQQGVYSHTSSIPAYPGADDDHAEVIIIYFLFAKLFQGICQKRRSNDFTACCRNKE